MKKRIRQNITKRKNKIVSRDGVSYLCLGILTLFTCWFFVGRYGVFGAKVDWISQHSVFPEYFRQLFYETGELFPEFAGNIGGGQNIYNFSYYGLYNPVILISYLLPFVKMSDYLMAASIAGLLASVWLLYYWLKKRGFTREIRLPVAMMFLLAGPMIYHSFHQIMFVNYMPFLCLAFLGIDRHFEKKKSGLYTISVFLMILTSFYFSIGGMLALVLYGLSRYLELREDVMSYMKRILWFLKDGICFLFPMFTAVLMSGILLVPTAFAILGGRKGAKVTDIWSLLIPDISIPRLAYSSYGIGLTTLIVTVLITGLTYQKWHERVLNYGCVLILSVPVFSWILNGGLYVRSKALIPFLPLLCYMIAVYLEKQKNREISLRVSIAAYLLTILLIWYQSSGGQEFTVGIQEQCLLLADGVLMLVCFLIFRRSGRLCLLSVPSVLCLFLAFSIFYSNTNDTVDREVYVRFTDTRIGETIQQILDEEKGFYRLEQAGNEKAKEADLNRIWDTRQWISSVYSSSYNADYQKFRKEVFGVEEPFRNDLMQSASDNPLYEKFMGVKYVVDGTEVSENDDVAPIIYATDQVISEQDYESLDFPYNQIALMRYAVIKGSQSRGEQWKRALEETAKFTGVDAAEYPFTKYLSDGDANNLKIKQTESGTYHIRADKKTKVQWKVTEEERQEETLLYVQFQVKNNNPGQDVAVWLNGTRNKLSASGHIYYNGNTMFTWVTTLEAGQTEAELTFGNGDYEISDMKCFLGDISVLENKANEKASGSEPDLYQAEFQPDLEKTKGNRIQGVIDVKNTGYGITSIPYDSGFEVYVDGKRTISEKVNTAFLGFPIAEGKHEVEIVYHAPGFNLGKMLSCLGVLLLGMILLREGFFKNNK